MHLHAVDLGQEVRELVHPRLGGAPVEAGAPVLGELLDVAQRRAAAPAHAGHLVGPAGGREPLLQVIELRLRDVDLELAHRAPLQSRVVEAAAGWRPMCCITRPTRIATSGRISDIGSSTSPATRRNASVTTGSCVAAISTAGTYWLTRRI